ncbi:MAG: Gfo/Idh/MocA family oxidoreductase [Bryobacteraceae bacterium]|nr:Gfo/Idh/MocA family oxidoreductase [Bryobacteraceae bacterium]
MRTALIGCGKVGHLHAAALRDLPESNFTAVCDHDPTRAAAFAAQYGMQAFSDAATMFTQAGIQAVMICTPHPLHAAPAILAAEHGVHALVEKPLAASLEDCDRMLDAAMRHGVQLGVVSQRRFFEPVLRMKAAIDAGKIGRPILGTVMMFSWRDEAYYRSDPWRGKWSTEGGGVLINQSPHHLDILQWLMGPIDEVTGDWANLSHPYVEVEDTALATLRFRHGGLGNIVVSLCQRPGIYTKIHIHGSNGASVGTQTDGGATFIAGMSNVLEPPVNDVWTIPGEEADLAKHQAEDTARFNAIDPTQHYHHLQIQDFLQAIRDQRPLLVPATEGRKVVALIQAIYQSGRERRPVKL